MPHTRKIIFTFILILISPTIFGQTASVMLTAENIQGSTGQLVFGIFDNEDDFKNKTKPFQAYKVSYTGEDVSHTFSDLPLNKYAIAVFHDANGDGKLNMKSMKRPTEGIGVSGNAPKMRPPKFEEVAFRLKNDTTIDIQMVYPASN